MNPRFLYRGRDEFGSIEVTEETGIRSLHFGTPARQSAMSLYAPDYLLLGYTRAMATALLFQEAPRDALLIGLGGGSLAKFLLHRFPRCRVEAVELRAEVAKVAKEYFDLPDSERLELILGDGVEYAARCGKGRYDLIMIDAYDHVGMAPALAEHGFLAHCRAALREGGVLAINTWKEERKLFGGIEASLSELFEGRLLRLPVERRGNLILLGVSRPIGLSGLAGLARKAQEMERKLEIELPRQLRELRRGNGVARLGKVLF